MRIITADQYEQQQTDSSLSESIDQDVLNIIENVKRQKDKALKTYTKKFDQVELDSLIVTEEEFNIAENLVDAEFIDAIQQAIENITIFHKQQQEKSWFITKEDGIMLGQQITPIEKVGIYIPGGKAAYPSTVVMNAIPAKIAKVPNISIVTPPQADGSINPYVLVTAKLVGVNQVYKVGGAQAIAALAYGTESIEPVDKIVGPGNDYVARAKKFVYGDVAIDMIAGPSELCVIADETAPANYVAADLLSQAEHDESAKVTCITTSQKLAKDIQAEVRRQTKTLERQEIIKQSLENYGQIIVVDELDEAFTIANDLAPEHLQLMIADAALHVGRIQHAGAIFIGNYSPEPLGDYLAGPNHTLPTSRTARFASPLGVYDFIKRSSIIHYSETALLKEAEQIMTIANREQLTGHAQSIYQRKEET